MQRFWRAEHRKDAIDQMTNHNGSFLRLDWYQDKETREVIDDGNNTDGFGSQLSSDSYKISMNHREQP